MGPWLATRANEEAATIDHRLLSIFPPVRPQLFAAEILSTPPTRRLLNLPPRHLTLIANGRSVLIRVLVALPALHRAAEGVRDNLGRINDGTRDVPPGHNLIGTDQREIAFVEVARFLVVDADHLDIQSGLNRRRQKCADLTLIVAKAKQRSFETKAIEQRTAIRQPDMRRSA